LKDIEISPLGKLEELRAEVRIGKSRIDYMAIRNGEKIWIEVKGCTLERNNVALFPDAPTERGRRHVEELHKIIKDGGKAALMILVFHADVKCFSPNREMDKEFSEAYRDAIGEGLEVYPIVLDYDGRRIRFLGYLPLCEN